MQAERVDVLPLRVGIQDGARPHAQAMADLDVGDLADAGGERAVEDIGLAETGAVVQPHVGGDEAGGALGGDRLGRSGGYSSCGWSSWGRGHRRCLLRPTIARAVNVLTRPAN